MLVSEELFLLLHRDDGKLEDWSAYNGFGMAAAVISDLVMARRVTLGDEDDPRVMVLDSSPESHPVLSVALERMEKQNGKRLSDLLTWGELELLEETAESLASAGIVEIRQPRMFGLVSPRYPVLDPAPERAVRERLERVLDGESPGSRDGTLLAILHGLRVLPTVFPEATARLGTDVTNRIEACASQVGDEVSHAVQVMNAALLVNTVLFPITGASSG